MTEKQISVPEIHCDHCKESIEGAVGVLPGVEMVNVDVEAKSVLVRFEESMTSEDIITAAIEERGFEVAGPLAAVVMGLSLTAMDVRSARFAIWLLATPVEFLAGWPFLRGAAARARRLSANMDTLIALGTLAAYLYSVWALFTEQPD